MYTIAKTWEFEAAHCLPTLPEGHKCRNPHGHSYTMTAVFQSRVLTPPGFVVDFADLDWIGNRIKQEFDHKDLNVLFSGNDWGQTTSENLAFRFYIMIDDYMRSVGVAYQLVEVTMSETRKTRATYRAT
jgi:6-pyruvoyltetrahydropterin/6-carboxytetrahydropterin synthase